MVVLDLPVIDTPKLPLPILRATCYRNAALFGRVGALKQKERKR
jgi:hypothetical protein